MKKLLILALLGATMATPALAQRDEHRRGDNGPRTERTQSPARIDTGQTPRTRGDGNWRGARRDNDATAPRAPAPVYAPQSTTAAPNWRSQRQAQTDTSPAPVTTTQRSENNGNWRSDRRARAIDTPTQQAQTEQRARSAETRGNWQNRRGNDSQNARQGETGNREVNRGDRQNWQRDRDGRLNRDADRRGDRNWNDGRRDNDRRYASNNWNRGWRSDRRYDWQDYRRNNRNIYRAGRYYAPYGWNYGYRRYSIGITLNSILYGSRYWINDPWYYRLPPAEYGYRWVRYYDDVLLIDTYTGEVVDVIYDFFYD